MASTTAESAKDESVGPKMSIIIATRGDFKGICKTVQHLRAQTICRQLELIVVMESEKQLQVEETELAQFAAFQLVPIGPFRSKAAANAAGARRARTPIVAFAEDHCFPDAVAIGVVLLGASAK